MNETVIYCESHNVGDMLRVTQFIQWMTLHVVGDTVYNVDEMLWIIGCG